MSEDENKIDTLKEKVEEADLALAIKRVDVNPEQWALASINFATALADLANHQDDKNAIANYQDALQAFKDGIDILRSEKYFPQRINASIQYIRTLRNFGLRQGGNDALLNLYQGVRLTDELIKELNTSIYDFDNAMFHIEKGQLYRVLASSDRQENRKSHLQNAIKALLEASNILRAKEKFYEWATALIGLGLSLHDLSNLQNNDEAQESLIMAINAFKSAAEFFQPDINPLDRAFAYMEMGRCSLILARRQTNDDAVHNAKLAVDAFKEALSVSNENIDRELYMRTRAECAQALSLLANLDPTDLKNLLTQAITLHRENIAQLQNANDPATLAIAHGFAGRDLATLALSCQEEERFQYREEALKELRLSISDELKKTRPRDWSVNLIELATTLHGLANELEGEDAIATFEEVITLYENARLSITKESDPILWARIQQWQALAFANTGEADKTPRGLQRMKLAELGFRQALTVFTAAEKPEDYRQLQKNLGHLLFVISQRPDCNNPLSFLNAAALTMETVCEETNDKVSYMVDLPALFHLAVILWKRAMVKDTDFEEDFTKANELFIFINHHANDENFNLIETQCNYAEFLYNWGERDLSRNGLKHLKTAYNLWKDMSKIAQKENFETLFETAKENQNHIKAAIKNHRNQQPIYKRLFWR